MAYARAYNNWLYHRFVKVSPRLKGVLSRLCCNLRKIVVADEILVGTNMIDELFGE
jgi:hypothetical protein